MVKNGLDINVELSQLEQYPLLDVNKGIAIFGGSQTALNDMLFLFLEKSISDNELAIFHRAHRMRDWETVLAIAHKLKGATFYCGAIRLQRICHYVEHYYNMRYVSSLEGLYKQFLVVLDQTRVYIVEWLRSPSS